MEIATIKGDEVYLIYHPIDASAEVGQQFRILELPDRTQGLIVQIISNDSLEYVGLQQELIQRVLEDRLATVVSHLDRESGMGEMRSLKIATAKIRKRIVNGEWCPWGGWIPTRNVVIEPVEVDELLDNVLASSNFPITFSAINGYPVHLSGEGLNMVNVITGVKGTGKSHTAKHLVLQLANYRVPVIVFDINGEYVNLPDAQVLRWGNNFLPSLDEVGYRALQRLINSVYPLPDNSQAVFSTQLPGVWAERRRFCTSRKQAFTIDIPFLRNQTWSSNQRVQDAIQDRLQTIDRLGLFHRYQPSGAGSPGSVRHIYDKAAGDEKTPGCPIVFDMRTLTSQEQQALVRAINDTLEDICTQEANPKTGRGCFPFVFYEEAHFYIQEATIINIITRGRHIGMATVFVTNTPQELPRMVFRQLDNLFLLGLTHNDDIRNVSNSSFTDEATIRSFATRMPQYHGLIIGNVTSRYPLVVTIDDLPEGVPTSGQTRSTWSRFNAS